MFSGIIEEKGRVKKISKDFEGCKLTVETSFVSKDVRIGDSISVNGVCLTVIGMKGKNLSFDVMEETLQRTTLSKVSVNEGVNLERSLKFGDRLSGHFVTGHVDCVGRISSLTKRANGYAVDIEFSEEKAAYVTEKGSIAIDGVSLTVADINGNHLRVYLIPQTLAVTNLGSKRVGDSVNIEFDILGKYATKNTASAKSKIDMNFLKDHGFT